MKQERMREADVHKVLDDPSLDTTTRTGNIVFGILASIAEFETALRRNANLKGWPGRKPKVRPEAARR